MSERHDPSEYPYLKLWVETMILAVLDEREGSIDVHPINQPDRAGYLLVAVMPDGVRRNRAAVFLSIEDAEDRERTAAAIARVAELLPKRQPPST